MTNPTGIGAELRRKEDKRFLTGRGSYVTDLKLPGMAHGVFLRSPHAHAKLVAIDTAAAMAMPGIIGVLTGAEVAEDGLGGVPCAWGINFTDGTPMKEPAYPALAQGKVRHVGDAVAFVVAETAEQARAAAEAVIVEYEELPAVINAEDALKPDAPQLYDDVPGNLNCDWALGDKAAVEAAFARAAHITRLELTNNRLVGNPMEPRAAVASYDFASEKYTLFSTTQLPHIIKLLLGAFILKIPQHRFRVVCPDMGGGFGVKQVCYAEEIIITWAAKRLGRTIKWVCERSEGFLSDRHGRDHITKAELALAADGTFLALKVETIANIGGYVSTFGPNIPTNLYAPLLAGVYRTPAIWCSVKTAFTNSVPVDAYRGAGRPEATFVLERIVDVAAMEMGIDKVEIRRRNMIPPDAYPYQTPVLMNYDSGDVPGCLDKALALADWDGFAARKAESAKQGKLRGIGLSTYIEACGLAPSRIAASLGVRGGLFESAAVRVHPTGHVTILIGTHNHGQGHETTYAQIVSQKLGVPADRIEVVCGDTDRVQFGLGTYGSRSLAVGGSALSKATDKILTKCRKIAAHMLEAAETDIVFEDGAFRVAGTDRAKSFEEICGSAYTPVNFPLETLEPGLEEQSFYDPPNFTFPAGAHVAEVEIDPDTGHVQLVSYVAVDDVGTVINPMIVEGQLHGGIAQGMGQALYEDCVYDGSSGQLLSGSFMDYAMPRADHTPKVTVASHITKCTHNDLGVKGAGEVGTIGSPSTIINAVVDALAPYGVKHVEMPASPPRIWHLINGARPALAAE
ncbi:xanthine dehydrogenase family protein molybdopterin-binding subunit [Paracraurococcus lichenis]|uniref:Xanthine dehydrogenase family protein molybdopterin-binding subunit n=1 Tax=Paracraurococcus lichenis TaxID=3064888 RepID=A0ABT9E9P4_9PROT|nr:xanthine dehydrogenase family protein molybdopterin-binding subunit [Paracraurococcus sp. LOR1-02]MDO9712914.1 xanthine dehydrogenase family protein molybdopterin-binding subunit [Paracraurococcus sp. LOR1-02]